ncbi:hypothetical protein ACN38_g10284 [Penicillium nordicum]|uniref:Uncharacterized protein n=1 Tax=Penicillium nordicum TaxID=229535 RepID=A0A0M8NU86_9EURO|nr:hypothetical protein ACN38_g10284 [Penicillium nordicum]
MQTSQTPELDAASRIWRAVISLCHSHVQATVWRTYSAPDIANSDLHYLLTCRLLMNLLIIILSLLLSGIFCLGGMTYTPFNDGDTYGPELPDRWERTPSYAPTPGYPDREWTP